MTMKKSHRQAHSGTAARKSSRVARCSWACGTNCNGARLHSVLGQKAGGSESKRGRAHIWDAGLDALWVGTKLGAVQLHVASAKPLENESRIKTVCRAK